MTSPTAPVITSTGITAPTFAQVYAYLVQQYQSIFGADAYLGNDSQDGQLLGVFAQAISDANSAAIAVYNSFSPTTAQGAGLSSVVAINGLQRLVPTSSTVNVYLTGNSNTVITNGVLGDANGNTWALPATTTIGNASFVTVTATCTTVGAVYITANTVLTIQTPSFGWLTACVAGSSTGNPSGTFTFVAGAQVETDAALRVRQAASVALPSQTVFEGIIASLDDLTGTTRTNGVENNTGGTSGSPTIYPYNVPANSLCFVVESTSTSTAILNAIFQKITPGIPTYGIPVASFSATIAGTTLTITGGLTGTIAINQYVQYPGMTGPIQITGGSGSTWTVAGSGVIAVSSPTAMWSGNFISQAVTDASGSVRLLTYNPPLEVLVHINLIGRQGPTWSTGTTTAISSEIASYFATLPIGAKISYFGLIPYISLVGTPYYGSFEITSFSMCLDPVGIGSVYPGATLNATTSVTNGVVTMTVNSLSSGYVMVGQQLSYGAGSGSGIAVIGGSGSSWTLSGNPSLTGANVNTIWGSRFTTSGVTSTTSMVVTSVTGTIAIGQQVWFPGVSQILVITGQTGGSTGLAGTYTLSAVPTVAIPANTVCTGAVAQSTDIPLAFNMAANVGDVIQIGV